MDRRPPSPFLCLLESYGEEEEESRLGKGEWVGQMAYCPSRKGEVPVLAVRAAHESGRERIYNSLYHLDVFYGFSMLCIDSILHIELIKMLFIKKMCSLKLKFC